jgi:ubiquinone/menaquinone biosynthesis C-methylase UbiE
MQKKQSAPDWKEVARQLSCPEGDNGIKTGQLMAVSNANMVRLATGKLEARGGENILEIGFGSGTHIRDLVESAPGMHYRGIDISPLMVQEAGRINADLTLAGNVSLELVPDGNKIPFPDNFFDGIFTVNTLYFWKEPEEYASEIYRVLKKGGRFCLCFAARSFMEKLPFTPYGFRLYDAEEGKALLEKAAFKIEGITEEQENVSGNTGENVLRDMVLIKAVK